jgi:hypothetical protein
MILAGVMIAAGILAFILGIRGTYQNFFGYKGGTPEAFTTGGLQHG